MKPGKDLRNLKNFTNRQAKQFRYKLPEDFYEIDLALQVLIHKLDPKRFIENVEKFDARKTVLVIDGLTELYATFDLEDDLKEKISAGIKKLSKMGATILLTRAVNLDGKQEHKLPCSPVNVINFITEESFHESFPDEMEKTLSMNAEQTK